MTPRRAGPGEWAAFGAVVVALAAFGILRVPCDDTVWHLATARLRERLGHWPTENTFSWTFPEHPVWQQYPVYQWMLLRLQQAGGWEALSVMTAVGWAGVFALWVAWAGGVRHAAALHLAWMIGLFALQRRMVLRPDLLSVVYLGVDLVAIDLMLRGRRLAAAVPLVVQVAWVNSHQLWPIGLGVQGLAIVHLVLARRSGAPLDGRGRDVPLGPIAVALVASLAATVVSPLGPRAFASVWHTLGSVTRHRDDVQEFAALWNRTPERELALLCAAPALWAFWRARRRNDPFELGVWLGTLALALMAVRGLVFFGITSIAIFSRTLTRLPPDAALPSVSPPVRRFLRVTAIATTLLLAGIALRVRWVAPTSGIGGTQPGLGRTRGDWPDAGLAFLARDAPPGRMMNMPWSLAASIWFLPELPVFVDPRFESYPRAFLEDAIRSYRDDAALDGLLARHPTSWIFVEHCHDGVRERIRHLVRARGWRPVHVDARTAVVVRPGPDTEHYLATHPLRLPAEPEDLVTEPPGVRADQLACYRELRTTLAP